MTPLRLLLVVASLFICGIATAAAPKVTGTFDDHGLTGLSYDAFQFIKAGEPRISNILFSDDKGGEVSADKTSPTVSFDRVAQRYSYSLPWGAVHCRYQVTGNRLNVELNIENDTAGPMSGIEMDLMELQFPRRPAGTPWEKRFQMISDNDGDITAQVADYKTGVLTFCNDDPTSAIRAGFSPGAAPPAETWLLRVTSQERTGPKPPIFVEPRSTKTFSRKCLMPFLPTKLSFGSPNQPRGLVGELCAPLASENMPIGRRSGHLS